MMLAGPLFAVGIVHSVNVADVDVALSGDARFANIAADPEDMMKRQINANAFAQITCILPAWLALFKTEYNTRTNCNLNYQEVDICFPYSTPKSSMQTQVYLRNS